MALQRKFAALESLKPDIAVISECANLDRLSAAAPEFSPHSAIWISDNPNKGLGVFGFNGHSVTIADEFDKSIRHVAPVRVNGSVSFNLLAVWAMNERQFFRRNAPLGPARKAVEVYGSIFGKRPTIVAGDFNNHVLWDKPGYTNNHINLVSTLERIGLVSAYHAARGVEHSAESEPTHYWRDRKKDGPTYHIDYIFIPQDWASRLAEMTVGSFDDWCGNKLSDHVPLVADIDLGER